MATLQNQLPVGSPFMATLPNRDSDHTFKHSRIAYPGTAPLIH